MMAGPGRFDLKLVSRQSISPSVCELVLERIDGAPIDFKPGQWLNLLIPCGGEEMKKAYSIASPPEGRATLELAVTRVEGGVASTFLHALPPGDTVTALGPHGLFTREPADPEPAIFVATGTGVTPLRSMILAALAGGSRAPMWVLLGVRHEEDIIYREQFEDLARRHDNVRFEVTLSQPAADWAGRRGYVQAHLPELYGEMRSLGASSSAEPPAPHVYVCGLDRMVTVVRDLARHTLGADRKHVHQERYD
jgi:CDP-4-dehydro-6-deoxyglucose reductase, E3